MSAWAKNSSVVACVQISSLWLDLAVCSERSEFIQFLFVGHDSPV